ncbi:hypothetical protein RDWZM_007946 [Blomia tropicalis]|uniref:Uncharacterized protein n=1 Tax=Blomia tropicalis TaxID=40697 RepID=A0A9Q0RJI5_BLOTA|nr:hypothetical protein RDWZM_007946 [Blomia tropicalis]
MTSISSVSQSSAPEYYIPPHSHLSSIADCTQAYDRLIKIINKEPLKLVNWGLPEKLLNYYHKKEISQLFEWQLACLDRPGVLTKNRNLVYSAPTSAGFIHSAICFNCNGKVNSLKRVLDMVDKRIETFAGSVEPPNGGVATVDVAVCTIEKANNIVNRMIQECTIGDIGLIVIDELHMIGDIDRGYLVELILSKIMYHNSYSSDYIQIIGMSATIPNLKHIARWLNAELFITDFRPVPLNQKVVQDEMVHEVKQRSDTHELTLSTGERIPLEKMWLHNRASFKKESNFIQSSLIYKAIETIIDGYSCLIFCQTKKACELLAESIATKIYNIGRSTISKTNDYVELELEAYLKIAPKLVSSIDEKKIINLIETLEDSTLGSEKLIHNCARFAVSFHHAGLSNEERAVIESGFRSGAIRVLCSTTTLSAGVNLPARRVMIQSPFNCFGQFWNVGTYRQMIGRAGRAGLDTLGESFLFCKGENFIMSFKNLINADLKPVCSHLLLYENVDGSKLNDFSQKKSSQSSTDSQTGKIFVNLNRAVLEVISNGIADNRAEVDKYISLTFYTHSSTSSIISDDSSNSSKASLNNFIERAIDSSIEYLTERQMITYEESGKYIKATDFGKAVVASGFAPEDGQFVEKELKKAARNIDKLNDLYLVNLVVPIILLPETKIDWQQFFDIWDKLSSKDKTVGELLGISEGFIISQFTGMALEFSNINRQKNIALFEKLVIHIRFYISLALLEVIQEKPLYKIAFKYSIAKGVLQSMQQHTATFAGMVGTFCDRLCNMDKLQFMIEKFQSRFIFACEPEIMPLMRTSLLTTKMARNLYNHGITSLIKIKLAPEAIFEKALLNDNQQSSQLENGIFIPSLDRNISVKNLIKMLKEKANYLIDNDKLNTENSDGSQVKRKSQI